mgnify:CR=1 FL=1
MYSQNIKAIRTKDGRLFIFYYSEGSLFFSKVQKGSPATTEKIIENISPMFSLWCSDNGIYLLLSGNQGVVLCFYNYSRWVSKVIARDFDDNYSKISFFTSGDSVHLLYSVKDACSGGEALYVRSMKKENWEHARKISDIMPFHSTAYFIGREDNNSVKIYYRISDKTVRYCSLNLSDGSLSESENLLATSMPCSDISIFTKNNESHILYLAQGMFSSQLIYKGIKAGKQIKARVIWEGQLSGSCSLFCFDGRLYALIYNERKVYAMYSDAGNVSFSLAKDLGAKINSSCMKSEYLDFTSGGSFSANEVIINTSENSFPVIEDIYPSFIPNAQTLPDNSAIEKPAEHSLNLKAAEYEEQLAAMSDQIGELSKTLAKRNEEIAAVSARWRMKYDAVIRENELLKSRIAEAEGRISASEALNASTSGTDSDNTPPAHD